MGVVVGLGVGVGLLLVWSALARMLMVPVAVAQLLLKTDKISRLITVLDDTEETHGDGCTRAILRKFPKM